MKIKAFVNFPDDTSELENRVADFHATLLLEKIKQLRINNTLAEFQRKILLNMKNKYEEFVEVLFDSKVFPFA